MFGLYTLRTHFLLHRSNYWWDEHRNNAPTNTTVGLQHIGALNIWGKLRFVKSIRHLKRSN